MTERTFVALDLETTGLEAGRDAILEIGAVRFQGEQILDRWSTLVNPRRPIPLRIQQLTGIRAADVATAPTLDEVIPELLAFVAGDVAAVVAHNAGFDLGFLRAAGIQLHRPTLDTFELATILLPGCASYNLGELCRTLDLPINGAHRGLGDAEATAHLFIALCTRLRSLPPGVLALIAESGQEANWPPAFLFAEAQRTPHASANGSPFARLDRMRPPAPPLPEHPPALQTIPPERLETFFAPDGALAQSLGGDYEARPGQVEMARQVLAALNNGEHLLIEAGTGTGKSLAYLLPAALWSVANGRRVVIATNTLALQDQLIGKDLPQVQRLLALAGVPQPTVALLKGRNNYLCTRRLHAWRTGRRLSAAEASLLAKVTVWAATTLAGDMGELLLASPTDRAAWLRLCSDPATCSPDRCGEQIGVDEHGLPTGDFFLHARAVAESVHLLIVNHALLLADLAAGGRVLPPYDHLIIDEAHHLEDVATDQLTLRIDWRWLNTLLRRLAADDDLGAAITLQAARQGWYAATPRLQALADSAAIARQEVQHFASRLLGVVGGLDGLRQETGYAQRVALDGRVRSQPVWSQLEVEWGQVYEALQAVANRLGELVRFLEEANWRQLPTTEVLLAEAQSLLEQLQSALTHLDAIVTSPKGNDGLIRWLEINDAGDTVTLASAPLHVNSVIEAGLVRQRRSTILTSATLRTDTGFDFIQERLGLWDVGTAVVESPFDYRASTLLLLPTNLPAPNQPQYQQAVEQAIIDTALALGGRTLALFTSYGQLKLTADAVRAPLDRANITVLQHGASSRTRLLREYRATERAVLLGTRSFWEGIDLPGDQLQALLIVRLPFAVPTDPLVAARTADLDDAFHDYTLPDAILRFRQGFGRLIRRATDRGVVVVLDSRVWQRDYGHRFLEALPGCTTRRVLLSNLGDEVQAWLG